MFGQQYQWLASLAFVQRDQTLLALSFCRRKGLLVNIVESGDILERSEGGEETWEEDVASMHCRMGFFPLSIWSVLSFSGWRSGDSSLSVELS